LPYYLRFYLDLGHLKRRFNRAISMRVRACERDNNS